MNRRAVFAAAGLKAFTITEMMVIVIVLGILAAIALPQYKYAVERLKASEAIGMLTTILGAEKRYKFENGEYTNVLQRLDVTIPPSKNFFVPDFLPDQSTFITQVKRNGEGEFSYALSIAEDGSITCSGGENDICAMIKTWP